VSTCHSRLPPDYRGELQRLAFVQYGFDRKEHPIDIKPHGNTKKRDTSFKRTKPSTLKLVKKGVEENKRPLKVLRDVENIQGGVMNAKSGCDLPRELMLKELPYLTTSEIPLPRLCRCVKTP